MPSLPSVDTVVAKVKALGIEIPHGPVRVDSYGDSESQSDELLALIAVAGNGGTGLVMAYEAEGAPLPRPGDIEIVVDHRHEPVLLTRITRVEIVPYEERQHQVTPPSKAKATVPWRIGAGHIGPSFHASADACGASPRKACLSFAAYSRY